MTLSHRQLSDIYREFDNSKIKKIYVLCIAHSLWTSQSWWKRIFLFTKSSFRLFIPKRVPDIDAETQKYTINNTQWALKHTKLEMLSKA